MSKKKNRLESSLCSAVYKELGKQQLLFEPKKLLNLESQQQFKLGATFYAFELCNLEQFVDALLSCDEVPFTLDSRTGYENNYLPSPSISRYFAFMPDFLKVVNMLSSRHEYSERINVFRTCCQAMGLLNVGLEWKNIYFDPKKTDPRFAGSPPAAEIFNTLVSNIRLEWKIKKTQAKVNARKQEADKRYDDYCNYVDALFNHCARLVVLRIDLFYKKQHAESRTVADITKDLNHLIENKRGNPSLFGFMNGYIAKLEYGFDKGMHWHVLFFFDGSKRNNASHIHLAESIGEYWINTVTKGYGDYWNVNANADNYDRKGTLGIGAINYDDIDLRDNLKYRVIKYLCKMEQFIKPIFGPKVKLFRRGNYPKMPDNKPGRPRRKLKTQTVQDSSIKK